MTDQEARDERETLIARAREVSGALEEYEFEGAAGEAAGLLNSLADALDRKHPEPEWEYDLETYWAAEIGEPVEIKECHYLYYVAVSGENLGSFETLARVEIELERYWFLKEWGV